MWQSQKERQPKIRIAAGLLYDLNSFKKEYNIGFSYSRLEACSHYSGGFGIHFTLTRFRLSTD